MTDIKEVEQRAQKMLNDIQRRKQANLADRVFREPGRRAAQKEMREREETEKLKQLEERWTPYLEKAMQHEKREREERDKLLSKFK